VGGTTYTRAQTAGSTVSYPFGAAIASVIPNRGTVTIISLMMLLISPTQAIFLPLSEASGSTLCLRCLYSADCASPRHSSGGSGTGLYVSCSVRRSARICVGWYSFERALMTGTGECLASA
jgi:hypothetical protein